jgi:hypothetical protein
VTVVVGLREPNQDVDDAEVVIYTVRLKPDPQTGVTAHTRTGSPTPLSLRLPRSSNDTLPEVRASERTVSDTSTSPDADRPLMRAAMLTAPP